MWHLGQHKFSVWLTCQNTWIPKADLLLKILRGKSAFKDLITQSVKSTRTKIWSLINIVNQILNWWKIPSEMEVALRYTLPTLFALLTMLALSTLFILWTGLDGVDGLDTPQIVMTTRAPAVLTKSPYFWCKFQYLDVTQMSALAGTFAKFLPIGFLSLEILFIWIWIWLIFLSFVSSQEASFWEDQWELLAGAQAISKRLQNSWNSFFCFLFLCKLSVVKWWPNRMYGFLKSEYISGLTMILGRSSWRRQQNEV